MNDVQKKELEIYKAIAKIFKKHNLRHFAIGGTCIGAIRHNGFIPWDDDIDIAMPRNDYELFRTKYFTELPNYFKKLDYDNTKSHTYAFTKIHDSRTTFVEKYAKGVPERFTGAFVDIMPIDGLPDNKIKQNFAILIFRVLTWLNLKSRPLPMEQYEGVQFAQAKIFFRKFLGEIFRYNFFTDLICKFGKKLDFDNSKMCIFTWRAYDSSIKRLVFPQYFFDSNCIVNFENDVMSIPSAYDYYLKQDFGDYMQPPPREQQVTIHNVYICDMNTPCSVYAEKERKNIKK